MLATLLPFWETMEEAGITGSIPCCMGKPLIPCMQMRMYIYEGPAGISWNCSENHLRRDYYPHLTDEENEAQKIRLTYKKTKWGKLDLGSRKEEGPSGAQSGGNIQEPVPMGGEERGFI